MTNFLAENETIIFEKLVLIIDIDILEFPCVGVEPNNPTPVELFDTLFAKPTKLPTYPSIISF
jgi:hypothetical protein